MTLALDKLKSFAAENVDEEEKKETPKTTKKLTQLAAQEKELPSKASRIGQHAFRKLFSGALSSPRVLAEFLRHGSQYLSQLGQEQAGEEGRLPSKEELELTQNIVKAFGFPAELFEKYTPGYTPENIEKGLIKLQELTGVKPAPQEYLSPEEEKVGEAFKSAGGLAPFGGITTLPARIGTGLLMEAGSAAAKEAGLGETGQAITGMSVPVILDIIRAIRNRTYIPQPGERQALLEQGRNLGLADEELAPILASRSQVGMFGKLAGGTELTEEALTQTNRALGQARERIFQRGSQIGTLPTNVARDLANDFTALRNRLGRTLNPAPEEQTLINFLNEAIDGLNSGAATVNDIMGFRRSINAIKGGETALGELKPRMQHALSRVDRDLARDFGTYNRLYEFYSHNLSRINPDLFRNLIGSSEAGKILGSFISGDIGQAAKHALIVPVLSSISSRIITDPVLQSIHRNIIRGINENRQNLIRGGYQQLKKYVKKEYPEESEKIKWPDFD